jgi:hypothetical protein
MTYMIHFIVTAEGEDAASIKTFYMCADSYLSRIHISIQARLCRIVCSTTEREGE